MASLDSVRQKIFRAAVHAKSLEPELEGYFKTNPAKVVLDIQSDPNSSTFTLQPKEPMPTRFGLIIGDCLQNLRSSLDYLVWELVLAANDEPTKDNMFPICGTEQAFVYQVSKRGRLDGIHPDALAVITALQPYHLGKDSPKAILSVLDELVNINKHRRVLLTMLRGANAAGMDVIEIDGQLWTHGNFPALDENTKIGPFPRTEKVQVHTELAAYITFDEGGAKGREITTSLNNWMLYVLEDIVPKFEVFFH